MLLAVVGTRCSGKSQIRDYYVSVHGFLPVYVNRPLHLSELNIAPSPHRTIGGLSTPNLLPSQANKTPLTPHSTAIVDDKALVFLSATELLHYVTKNWQHNFITTDLCTRDRVNLFARRPFFMLISVDAPLTLRFKRSEEKSLEKFAHDNDRIVFGVDASDSGSLEDPTTGCLMSLRELITVHIFNSFETVSALHNHLEELNLLEPERLRPGWDAYFMTLASLASQRSNCMKRRVGAVLVRDNRVVSTGYNGTPRGLLNCNEGGCATCNGTTLIQDVPVECVCLHAEENALLEAGRERVGTNAVLYCNTCPCLRCTIKIIQTGVKTVVYNLTYKVDEMSALLFQEASVEIRRYNPPRELK